MHVNADKVISTKLACTQLTAQLFLGQNVHQGFCVCIIIIHNIIEELTWGSVHPVVITPVFQVMHA